ncbi:MAG: glycosyltransferase family 2 protein [Rhodobacteraceae bacterium]|nr:glycosyltransferase family 2 protein [Paracoccaceae bacterium]
MTVIVPVYNRQRVVIETLDSVVNQSNPPRFLVIVDDGSTDKTSDTIAKWINQLYAVFTVLKSKLLSVYQSSYQRVVRSYA